MPWLNDSASVVLAITGKRWHIHHLHLSRAGNVTWGKNCVSLWLAKTNLPWCMIKNIDLAWLSLWGFHSVTVDGVVEKQQSLLAHCFSNTKVLNPSQDIPQDIRQVLMCMRVLCRVPGCQFPENVCQSEQHGLYGLQSARKLRKAAAMSSSQAKA